MRYSRAREVLRVDLPFDFLAALGRVVVVSSQLEGQLALVIMILNPEERDGDWLAVTDNSPLERLRQMLGQVPEGMRGRITQSESDARDLLGKRHALVHSLAVVDQAALEDDEVRWLSVHPRSGTEGPTPSAEEVNELAERIEALSAQILRQLRPLADSLRTGPAT